MGEHKPKNTAKNSEPASLSKNEVTGSVKRGKLPGFSSRKRIFVIFLIVLACSLTAGLALYMRQVSFKTASVCDSSIAKEAHEQNVLKNIDTFERLAKRVQLKENWDKDPNCLYVITEYQITIADLTNAKANIDKLKKEHSGFSFDKELDGGKASIETLQSQYNRTNDAEQNSRGKFDPEI